MSDLTLKAGPQRLLTFLQGVAEPAICAQFAPLGWSDGRVEEAWSLLGELRVLNLLPAASMSDPVAEAIAGCEEWQGTGLVRARAMMQLTLPEQASFLFHDLEAQKGMAAVLNVVTFLERRQVLASGAARKASRKADHEALAILEETGTTKDVLAQLEAFVATVQTVVAVEATSAVDMEAKRVEVLRKIHAWITAWSEMARTVVTRRDHLIRLGLAKRRSPKGKRAVVAAPASPVGAGTPAAAPAAAAPAAAAPAAAAPAVAAAAVAMVRPVVAPPALATTPSLDDHDTGPQSRAA